MFEWWMYLLRVLVSGCFKFFFWWWGLGVSRVHDSSLVKLSRDGSGMFRECGWFLKGWRLIRAMGVETMVVGILVLQCVSRHRGKKHTSSGWKTGKKTPCKTWRLTTKAEECAKGPDWSERTYFKKSAPKASTNPMVNAFPTCRIGNREKKGRQVEKNTSCSQPNPHVQRN